MQCPGLQPHQRSMLRRIVGSCLHGLTESSPVSVWGAAAAGLLPFAVLDHLLDLLLHRIEVEGSRILHRRIINRRQRQLLDILLDQNEPPELSGEEVVAVAQSTVL